MISYTNIENLKKNKVIGIMLYNNKMKILNNYYKLKKVKFQNLLMNIQHGIKIQTDILLLCILLRMVLFLLKNGSIIDILETMQEKLLQ